MIGLRNRHWRHLGAVLGGAALYLQLVFAGWGMLAMAMPDAAADTPAAHAFCFAGQPAGAPAKPADAPAAPGHDHAGFCCLWHPLPGVQPPAALTPLPVVYTTPCAAEPAAAPGLVAPQDGPVQARAPPSVI
jgi:hypothetical protein